MICSAVPGGKPPITRNYTPSAPAPETELVLLAGGTQHGLRTTAGPAMTEMTCFSPPGPDGGFLIEGYTRHPHYRKLFVLTSLDYGWAGGDVPVAQAEIHDDWNADPATDAGGEW